MKGRKGKHWEAYRGARRTRKHQKKGRSKPVHSRAMEMAKMRFEETGDRAKAREDAKDAKRKADKEAKAKSAEASPNGGLRSEVVS